MTKKNARKIKRINKAPRMPSGESFAPSVPMDVLLEQGENAPVDRTSPVSAKLLPSVAPLLLNVAEVCALLNISRSTFFRMKKAGEIPGCVSLGGQVRFRREDLEQWIKLLPESR